MSDESESYQKLVVRYGFLVRVVEFRSIKLITTFLILLLVIDLFFSCKLFVSAIQIRSHLGYFINMVSSGDGDTLPSLQAVPVLFFFVTNVVMSFFLFSAFDNFERSSLNRLMFFTILFGAILLLVVFIIIICVISHAYSAHESLHDGIVTAMNHYLNNTAYKSQIDRLQIEFQCCGSKKYDEWYTVKWLDPTLREGSGALADGNTPFSCCSMKSLSPCVHHNIEITGKAYLYTPEFNLSVSTRGCYEMIRDKKKTIGWGIVGNLCLFLLLEILTLALFRFVQTAHFERSKFDGNSRPYTIWLIGSYVGKVKRDAPQPPPVPTELKN